MIRFIRQIGAELGLIVLASYLAFTVIDHNRCESCHWYRGELLERAVNRGDADSIRYLLRRGADVNFDNGLGGEPSVITVVQDGRLDALQALIEGGADVNVTDRDGKTALEIAKTPEIRAALLRAGARPRR